MYIHVHIDTYILLTLPLHPSRHSFARFVHRIGASGLERRLAEGHQRIKVRRRARKGTHTLLRTL